MSDEKATNLEGADESYSPSTGRTRRAAMADGEAWVKGPMYSAHSGDVRYWMVGTAEEVKACTATRFAWIEEAADAIIADHNALRDARQALETEKQKAEGKGWSSYEAGIDFALAALSKPASGGQDASSSVLRSDYGGSGDAVLPDEESGLTASGGQA